MALRLEEIYSKQDGSWSGEEYARAFRDFGIDLAELSPLEAAKRIRTKTIRLQLTRVLDIWSAARSPGRPHWKQLLEVAKAADPDAWRSRMRDALAREDSKALKALAAQAPVRELPAGTLYLLAVNLRFLDARNEAVALLRQAQRQYPDDFWLNHELGSLACFLGHYEEGLRCYTAAQAIRPRSSFIAYCVASAWSKKKCFPEAVAQCSRAIELKPDDAAAYFLRADAYQQLQQPDKAKADLAKLRELDPNFDLRWSRALKSMIRNGLRPPSGKIGAPKGQVPAETLSKPTDK